MLLFGRCRVSVKISAQQFPKLAYVYAHCDYSYSIRIRPNSKDPLFGTALNVT